MPTNSITAYVGGNSRLLYVLGALLYLLRIDAPGIHKTQKIAVIK